MATKKKIAKKSVKKTAKKSSSQEITIRVVTPTVASITEPIKGDGGKYMIPKTWMDEKQVLRILAKTPEQHIYTRPGKGGGTFKYVTGSYIEKVLNYTFGWNWDFEVVSHGKEGVQVWVLGKLIVRGNTPGQQIVKTQFGRADIKMKKGTSTPLDYGNDLKAATTDALKKCASLLGIASDVYGVTEFKEETGNNNVDVPPKDDYNQDPEFEDHVCRVNGCGKDLTKQEADYSKKMFGGKELCREHQAVAREYLKNKKSKK